MPKTRLITLTFKVNDHCEFSDQELSKVLYNTVEGWQDGRYDFPIEMIHVGLVDTLKNCIYRLIGEKLKVKYGKEIVRPSPNSETYRWCIEQEKECKEIHTPYVLSGVEKVQVKTIEEW